MLWISRVICNEYIIDLIDELKIINFIDNNINAYILNRYIIYIYSLHLYYKSNILLIIKVLISRYF